METLTYRDWRRGITDNYLSNDPKFAARLDNFLLDEMGSPYTRPGWYGFSPRMPVTVLEQRSSGLYIGSIPFEQPFNFRGSSAYFLNESDVWTEVLGPNSNQAAPNKETQDFESLVIWNKQLIYAADSGTTLPHRIYCTDLSPRTFTALTLGLLALASTPTATAGTPGTTYTYLYAFHHYYEFTDYNGTVFVERGPVTYITATAANAIAAGAGNTITLGSVPVLANSADTNYDVSTSLKIKVARTVNNGSTFYYLTTLNNGTTSYADTTTDAVLDDNEVLYTDGGVLDYNQPPEGTLYTTQVNGYFWYATDRSLTHSIQGAPGACPDEYEYETDQKVIGLNSTINFPVLFCDQSIYRVEGVFDEFGDGGFELREIHPTAGCVANRSIIRVPGGLVWAGNGGFYFTDGYQVQKISKHLERSYQNYSTGSFTGCYDSLKNIAFWTASSGVGNNSVPNDIVLALHLSFGLSEESSFTTLSSENNIFPTVCAYSASEDIADRFKEKLLLADARGYLFIQDDNVYVDDVINNQVQPEDWTRTKAIIYRLESCALVMGDDSVRQYCTELSAILNHETETAVQFLSRADDGGNWGTFSEIRKDGALTWGITEYPWNGSNDTILHPWNSLPVIEGKRAFPVASLRSIRRQIGLTNAKTWISKSDTLGLGTATVVSAAEKYIDLNTITNSWPEDCDGYEILFSGDSYTAAYPILDRTSATRIRVLDPWGTMPTGSTLAWQMRGYRKHERISLDSFTIHFDTGEQTMTPNLGQSSYLNA